MIVSFFSSVCLISQFFFVNSEYTDEGDPIYTCTHCGAIMWHGERLNKCRNAKIPTFSLCCMQGQVKLHLLKEPQSVSKKWMEGED